MAAAAVNGIGLSRRRHRNTALRDSPEEEEGQMELPETVRSRERERLQKVDRVRDRDQELMSQRKRRRTGKCLERSFGGEESSGASAEETYDDEDYEEPSSSSIMSNHGLRRTVNSTRNFKSIFDLRLADEMIGAEVPRRTRSASVKRLNEQWTSSLWGFGEQQRRRPSSLGKKMVILQKPKCPISKVSRKAPLPSIMDDIEIEVVEALFDLMKQSQSQLQSHSSKKDERISKTKSELSPDASDHIGPEASDLPPESVDAHESTEEINLEKGKESSKPAQGYFGGDHQVVVVKKEESRSCAKLYPHGSADSTVSKANLTLELVKPKMEAKFEIDLMAPPPVPSSPDRNGFNILLPDLKLDLEMSEQEDDNNCSYNNLQQRNSNHCAVADSERQNFGCFPRPGGNYFHLDKTSRTTALQLAPFKLSQPRTKRCMTHQCIARNIRHHQQLTRKNMLPAATGPATSHETQPCSHSPTTSTPNSYLGNPLLGDLSGRHTSAIPSVSSAKGKSFEVAKAVYNTKCKLVPQQTSDKAPAANLLKPALMFPLGQQHQSANVTTQQLALDNSATLIGKAALSNNAAAGGPALDSFSFPAGKTGVSFNYSNLPTGDAPPFMAILHSNTHPYSISTHSGVPLPIKGTQSPVLPFFSASYYPSMYCMPQNQQNQLASLPPSNLLCQVQQACPTTDGSTSSHEQSNSTGSQTQTASNDKKYGIPFQAMNFPLVFHEDGKQQQPRSDCRVAVIPPQAVGYSFNSTTSTKPGGHFSTLPQETAGVQMLSGVGQLAYQFVPSAQVAQHKNYQGAERKCAVDSNDTDDEKKGLLAKSVDQSLKFSKLVSSSPSASIAKEFAVDGSTRTRSSLPPSNSGNQSYSTSTTPIVAFSVNTRISQQQQQQKEISQLQKQYTQQMQLTGMVQLQAPMSNNIGYSFNGCNYPNSNPIFSLVHSNNIVHSSQFMNTSIATTSQNPSFARTSKLKNLPQQQSRNSRGQQHMSFGSSLNSATFFRGQKFYLNSQPTSSVVNGHSSNSSGSGSLMRPTSGGSKSHTVVAELPPQQIEVSNGPSQKSVPVCGRDVPSMLSTCTSQLPELKY